MAIFYHDFVILAHNIVKNTQNQVKEYTVRVLSSPMGEGEQLDYVEIENYGLLQTQVRGLSNNSLDIEELKNLGILLGDIMLPEYARSIYFRSLDWINRYDDLGLRIRLRLPKELSSYPWEYMLVQSHHSESAQSDFVVLNPKISLVRHEELAVPAPWFAPGLQRRILITMSTVGGRKLAYLPREQRLIKESLAGTTAVDPIYIPQNLSDFTGNEAAFPSAKADEVLQALQHGVDIFHFSGHGKFPKHGSSVADTLTGTGSITLAGPGIQIVDIKADDLLVMLRGHGVRLVVLGACETSAGDPLYAWNNVATALLKGEISAVVAMQFKVNDRLAALFMGRFYEALAGKHTVDEAVSQGRQAMYWRTVMDGNAKAHDWGTPVLHLRTPGGFIFPPIGDEAAREQAENQVSNRFRVQQSMYTVYSHYAQTSRGAGESPLSTPVEVELLSRRELLNLEAQHKSLDFEPIELLHLLRSAVAADTDEGIWLNKLNTPAGMPYIQRLDAPISEQIQYADETLGLLGVDPTTLEESPPSLGMLSFSAAHNPGSIIRRTAALALSVMEPAPKSGLHRIDEAVATIDKIRKRRQTRAELRGALADVREDVVESNRKLPVLDRLSIWYWRVRRRALRDRENIILNSMSGALGAALMLGIWRALLSAMGKQTWLIDFFVYSYIGALLGLGIVFGLSVATSTLLIRKGDDIPPRMILQRAILLGFCFYGLSHTLIFVFTSLNLEHIVSSLWQAFTGLLLGVGYTLVIAERMHARHRLRLAVIAWVAMVATAILAQVVLNWVNAKYAATVISLNAYYLERLLGAASEVLGEWLGNNAGWEHPLMVVDTLMAYVMLALGTSLGLANTPRIKSWWQQLTNGK